MTAEYKYIVLTDPIDMQLETARSKLRIIQRWGKGKDAATYTEDIAFLEYLKLNAQIVTEISLSVHYIEREYFVYRISDKCATYISLLDFWVQIFNSDQDISVNYEFFKNDF